MIEIIKVKVLKPFYYSFSMTNQKILKEGEVVEIYKSSLAGLKDSGYVTEYVPEYRKEVKKRVRK